MTDRNRVVVALAVVVGGAVSLALAAIGGRAMWRALRPELEDQVDEPPAPAAPPSPATPPPEPPAGDPSAMGESNAT